MVDADRAAGGLADSLLPVLAATNPTKNMWCPSPRERHLIWQHRQAWIALPVIPAVTIAATLLMRFILKMKLGFLLAVVGPGALASVATIALFRWLESRSRRQPAIAIPLPQPVSGTSLPVRGELEFRPALRSSRAAGHGALGFGLAGVLMCLLACRMAHPVSMVLNVALLFMITGMLTLEWFICRRTQVRLGRAGLLLSRPFSPDAFIDWAELYVVQQPLPAPSSDGRVPVRTWVGCRHAGKIYGLRSDLDGFDQLVAAILERVPPERHVHPFLPAAR